MIPSSAKTQDGVLRVPEVGAIIYYEIPRNEFTKPFLWWTASLALRAWFRQFECCESHRLTEMPHDFSCSAVHHLGDNGFHCNCS